MRLAWVAVVVGASACNSILGIGDFSTGDGPLPPPDLPPDCVGRIAPLCGQSFDDDLTLDGVLDTDGDPRCTEHAVPGAPAMCAIVHGTITITAGLRVTGSRPLMLGARTIAIDGPLDATSSIAGGTGAGANAAECPASAAGTDDDPGGSGGAGGTLAGKGGNGGANLGGILGGDAPAAIAFSVIHGGCPGAAGGNGGPDSAGAGGAGGAGGGAVYLAARESIAISATGAVFVSGAGGRGAVNPGVSGGAGGGGGSGGMIVLDAPAIAVAGTLTANGGGGGGGGDTLPGSDGTDGATLAFDTPAPGGEPESATDGGLGGAGAAISVEALDGGAPPTTGGAGGGGGGVGFVIVTAPVRGGQISPAPTTYP
ncbi:MAG: hypothetical protein KF773_22545 [Deltaproteobacteria bacterium]|nr:hypothetical protein [Deltaproteobacteria bacterium]